MDTRSSDYSPYGDSHGTSKKSTGIVIAYHGMS